MFEGPSPYTSDELPQAYIWVWLAVLLLCYSYNLQDEIQICRMHLVLCCNEVTVTRYIYLSNLAVKQSS